MSARLRRRWPVLLLGIACALGCSGGGRPAEPPPDGGPDAAADGASPPPPAVAPPASPAAPEPTRFTCPDGWGAVDTSGGARLCEAWPGGRPPSCGEGEVAFPGEGCAPIGPACPADGWPAGLPASGVVFVRAGEPAGGDGTRERPYDRVSTALSRSASGSIVALSIGTYEEAVVVRNRTLWGACPAGTSIHFDHPAGVGEAIVTARDQAGVRGLRIEGRGFGVYLHPGAEVSLESVWIRDALSGPYVAEGARLDARELVVQRVEDSGLELFEPGARITVRRAWLESASRQAVAVYGIPDASGVELSLEDVAILDPGDAGIGILDSPGATVSLRRVVVAGSLAAGIFVVDGLASLEDVVVLDSDAARMDGMVGGSAIWLPGSSGTVRQLLIEANEYGGLSVLDGGHVDVEGLILRGARGAARGGDGLSVTNGAEVVARHVHLEDASVRSAVAVGLEGASLTVEDLTAVSLSPPELGLGGVGVNAEHGRATIRRARFERLHAAALSVVGDDAELDATDVEVAGIDPTAVYAFGLAAQVHTGARLRLERAHVVQATGAGLYVVGATAELADVEVAGTAAAETPLAQGDALVVLQDEARPEQPTRVSAVRFLARGSLRHAAIAYGTGVTLALQDAELRDTSPAPCTVESCRAVAGGAGLACVGGARLEVTTALSSGARFAGLVLAERCSAELHDVLVRQNAIGLLSDETVVLDGALDRVRFEDNEVDFQTTTLTVPPPDRSDLLLGP